MSKGDGIVESGADKLDGLAETLERKGGLPGRLGPELRDDASFLRKLRPSLMVARARRHAPKDQEPGTPARPAAPSGPQLGPRTRGRRGPNPFAVAAGAFGVGALLAKLIDWRSHAHPRR
jgi:hypothetical protein